MKEILTRVYCNTTLTNILHIISYIVSAVGVAVFGYMLAAAYLDEPVAAVCLALAAGIPFVLVSVIRSLINAPRPYEKYGFYERVPKDKLGRSFPSRHVFSIFIIATLSYQVHLALAIVLSVLGAAMAAARVLLGIHYIRDVVAGMLVGIGSGIIGLLLL